MAGRSLIEDSQRFEFVRELGAGGMGVVVEAVDQERGMRVALKGLQRLSAEDVLRFKTEFRALRDVQHPNLVRLGELFDRDGRWFFTMELLRGVDFLAYVRRSDLEPPAAPTASLAKVTPAPLTDTSASAMATVDLDSGGGARSFFDQHVPEVPSSVVPFDEIRLRGALAQLTTGLMALHAAGKVHRDVKPSNIVVEDDGRVVLVDFGVVAEAQRHETRLVGTIPYIAPEHAGAGGTVTPAADWYAVGCVLFEALTGTRPFPAAVPELALAHKRSHPAPSPSDFVADLPPDLAELCESLMDRAPPRRPDGPGIVRALGGRVEAGASHAREAPYVGRGRELDLLWRAHRGDEHRTFVIEGPSGVGKSALVEQFAKRARNEEPDVVVLSGRCHERESVPYKAFDGIVDQLGRFLRDADARDFHALMPDDVDALFRVFPTLRVVEDRVFNATPPESLRFAHDVRRAAFQGLRALLEGIARSRPLILIVDDIHWADTDSIALLQHLFGDVPLGLTFVATARLDGMTLPQIFDALGPDLQRVSLEPLSDDDSVELASALLGDAASTIDLAQFAKESRGHPMFIRELAVHTRHTGASSASLDDALWSRAHALDRETLALLELIAVGGTPLRQGVIAEAAGLAPVEYARMIARLRTDHMVRQRGVRTRDTIEPYHDRVRESLYARLDPRRRVELHGRLANALEAHDSGPALLADHLAKAERPAEAAVHALRAARAAKAALAFEQAVSRYRQALALAGEGAPERTRTLVEYAEAAIDAGRAEEAADAFSRASLDENLDGDERRDLRRRAAESFLMAGNLERGLVETRALLKQASLGMPRSTLATLLKLLWHQWRFGQRQLEWETRTEPLSKAEGNRLDTFWSAGAGLSLVDTPMGTLYFMRGARACIDSGDPDRIARALLGASIAEMAAGNERRADLLVEAAQRAAEQSGRPMARCYAQFATAAKHHMLDGDWPACLAVLDEVSRAWSATGRGDTWENDMIEVFRGWAYTMMTKFKETREHALPIIARAQATGNRFQEVNFRTYFFGIYLADDDPDKALHDVDDAMARWIPESEVFGNQAYYALRARTFIHGYANTNDDPYAILEDAWRRFDRTILGQVSVIRMESNMLRSTLALSSASAAAARGAEAERKRYLRIAARYCRRVSRGKTGVAQIACTLPSAGVAHLRDGPEAAVEVLRSVLPLIEGRQMVTWVAIIKRRIAQMIGGDEGARLQGEADALFASQGIVSPQRMTAMFCPGWPEDFR